MDTAHVRLTCMEIDDLVISFPLVGGVPRWQNLPRNRSDVVAEVRRAPFGRDLLTMALRIHTEVRSVLPRAGRFNAHVQIPKARLPPGGWKGREASR